MRKILIISLLISTIFCLFGCLLSIEETDNKNEEKNSKQELFEKSHKEKENNKKSGLSCKEVTIRQKQSAEAMAFHNDWGFDKNVVKNRAQAEAIWDKIINGFDAVTLLNESCFDNLGYELNTPEVKQSYKMTADNYREDKIKSLNMQFPETKKTNKSKYLSCAEVIKLRRAADDNFSEFRVVNFSNKIQFETYWNTIIDGKQSVLFLNEKCEYNDNGTLVDLNNPVYKNAQKILLDLCQDMKIISFNKHFPEK
jgi:hypothetical protein